MEGHINIIAILSREHIGVVEDQVEGRRVRLHLNFRRNRLRALIIFALRFIENFVAVTVRPPEVAAVLAKIVQFFGRKIVAQPVSAIVRCPERVGLRINS